MYKKTLKAFTLPEILISLSVIIILSAVLLPSLAGARQRAARAAAVKTISTLREKSEVLVTGNSDTKVYQSDLCTVGFNQDLLSINSRLGYGEGKLSTTVASTVSTTNVSVNNSTSCFEKSDGTAWFVITDVKQKDDEKELFCTDYTGFAGIIQEGYSLEDWQCDADNNELVYGTGSGYSQGSGGTLCTGPDCSIKPPCVYNPLYPDKCPLPCKNPNPVTGKCDKCIINPKTGKCDDTPCPQFDDPTTPWKENDCDCDKDGIPNDEDKCDKCDKDGSLLDSCGFVSKFENIVRGIIINPDGTIIGSEQHGSKYRIRKADSKGNIISSFDTKFSSNFPSMLQGDMLFGGMTRLSDGRYVIPSTNQGGSMNSFIVLSADGKLDQGFMDNVGAMDGDSQSMVFGTLQLPNGEIVVYGRFDGFHGVKTAYGIARFKLNGELSNIQYAEGVNYRASTATVDGNGKITVFSGSANTDSATRFNANGTVDNTFNFEKPANLGSVRTSILGSSGSYYLGNGDNQYATGIVKLKSSGDIDTAFMLNIGSGAGDGINTNYGTSIGIQSSGKIIIGGHFTQFNNTNANKIIRLNTNGTIDSSFSSNLGSGPEEGTESYGSFVRQVKIDSNDEIIISGEFRKVSGENSPYVARLEKDGKVFADN